MTNEKILDAIGGINEKAVQDAKTYKRPKSKRWFRWGAMAACLCLLVCGTFFYQQYLQKTSEPVGGQGAAPGGLFPDGVDPITYSIAVYPATENIEDVASAEVISLTESEVMNNSLAKHLPEHLPSDFHFSKASVYNTIMKDGMQYNMLRVQYTTGAISEQHYTEDGEVIAANPEETGDLFTVCVMNYEPNTGKTIYSSIEDVTVSSFESGKSACIRLDGCYVSVFPETADPAAIFEALKSIK